MTDLDKKGMTLLETLVALGIFSIVIVFTMGLFISGIQAQRKASELNLVNNEGGFLLERMAREIRMAKAVNSITIRNANNTTDKNPGERLQFTNHDNKTTVFCTGNELGTCVNPGTFISIGYDGNFSPASSPGVSVTKLDFYLNGDIGAPDTDQPMITILLELASTNDSNIKTKLQTSIVPRVY